MTSTAPTSCPAARSDRLAVVLVPAAAWAGDSALQTKVDRALQAALSDGSATQRVIIRTTAGYRSTLKSALKAHGDRIIAEHGSLDALTVEVHTGDIGVLANDVSVLSISLDATSLRIDSNHIRLSGTSMATAVTSGVAALVLQASRAANTSSSPRLGSNGIKAILEFTAIDTSAPLGSAWLMNAVDPFSTIGSETYAWAQCMSPAPHPPGEPTCYS